MLLTFLRFENILRLRFFSLSAGLSGDSLNLIRFVAGSETQSGRVLFSDLCFECFFSSLYGLSDLPGLLSCLLCTDLTDLSYLDYLDFFDSSSLFSLL